MSRFQRIRYWNWDVSGALAQLKDHPDLWGQIPLRTVPGSPHEGTSDIWLRFRAFEEILDDPVNAIRPHISMFYPSWWILTELHPIVYDLMARMRAVQLGGILLTKIPPGGRVKPHADAGWHPEFYNAKVYVALQSNPSCVNRCEDEETVIKAGEAVMFDNLKTHSVENGGDTDRITLIVCMRTENERDV